MTLNFLWKRSHQCLDHGGLTELFATFCLALKGLKGKFELHVEELQRSLYFLFSLESLIFCVCVCVLRF